MSLKNIPTGKDVPNDINVIIEIAAHSSPVKYEVDKESGALFVDRFLSTAMVYPCNYGYVNHTLSEDGDPVDVLVITPHPLIAGSIIRARPIGMLRMSDESGIDAKVLAVPVSKLSKEYDHVNTYEDVSKGLIKSIQHFFTHYKDNEAGKWSKVEGWVGVDEAKAEIVAGVERYTQSA
jgi:inorganic pyrophosphatase